MASIETPRAQSDEDDELIVTREALEDEPTPRLHGGRRLSLAALAWVMRGSAHAAAHADIVASAAIESSSVETSTSDNAPTPTPKQANAALTIFQALTWLLPQLLAEWAQWGRALLTWLDVHTPLPRALRAGVARLRTLAMALRQWVVTQTPLPLLWWAGADRAQELASALARWLSSWLASEQPLPSLLRRSVVRVATLARGLLRRIRAASASGPAIWERRLTLRQKALRAGSITLLVGLTLYLLLDGPAATLAAFHSAADALNARLHPPKAQPTLAESSYVAVKSPPGAYNLPEISLAPAPGKPGAAWACWTTPDPFQGQRGVWTALAYVTSDGGGRWTRLTLPQSAAVDCNALADPERPNSALMVLNQGLTPDGNCIAPFLFLTTDGGASWTQVAWPIGPSLASSAAACEFQAALQGGAIYLWSDTPLLRDTNPYLPPTGRLLVTRDGGQTWGLADNGLDDSSGLAIVGFRPGGRILATIADPRGPGDGAGRTLMASDDYGASWRNLGALPGGLPEVYVSNDQSVTDHGGWGRLYELAETLTNGLSSVPAQLYLATAYIGQRWAPIPLPPIAAQAINTPQSLEPLVIGLGPSGSLEVERGAVDATNTQLSQARILWVWSPQRKEWLLDPEPIPGNLDLEGASWRAGSQVFWLTVLQLGVPPVLQIYTKTYPADLLTRIGETTEEMS